MSEVIFWQKKQFLSCHSSGTKGIPFTLVERFHPGYTVEQSDSNVLIQKD